MLNGQEIAIAPLFLFHIHLTKEISSVFFFKKNPFLCDLFKWNYFCSEQQYQLLLKTLLTFIVYGTQH